MVRRFCWLVIIKLNYCKVFEILVFFNDCFDLVLRLLVFDKNIDFYCIKNLYWLRFLGFMNINFLKLKFVKVYLFDIFFYFDINVIINFILLKCLLFFSNIFVKKILNLSLLDKYFFF